MHTTSTPTVTTTADPHAGAALLAGLERGSATGLRISTALLLGDSIAAIGFAGGLAGAVAQLAVSPEGAVPWLALALASACLRGAASMSAARSGACTSGVARLALRRRVVAGALSRTDGATVGGGLMQMVVEEVDAMDAYLARYLPTRRAAAVAPLLVLAAIACASPLTAAILLATLVPFILLMALAGAASASESGRQFAALGRLSGLFADRIRALPIVLAFGAQAREADRLGRAAEDVAKRTLRVLRLAFLSSAVLEFFGALCVALVAVYAGFNLLGLLPFHVSEKLDLGRAFFVLALAPEFHAPMRRLATAYHDRQAAATAAGRLAGLAEHGPAQPVDLAPVDAAPAVRFEQVVIRYPGSHQPVVAGLSFEVPAGRMVAIVGASGSGKTSLLRLLLGAAPLSGGRVLVGELALADGQGVAAQAAWIGQSPLVVPGSLHRNLALARPDACTADILEAAAQAGLGPLLARRDGGLGATIGARGGGLSGGERRRIALARALLKPSAIWLLDEPTAHLDEASEAALIATIVRTRAGRTTLVATHSERLAAVADMVIRLDTTR